MITINGFNSVLHNLLQNKDKQHFKVNHMSHSMQLVKKINIVFITQNKLHFITHNEPNSRLENLLSPYFGFHQELLMKQQIT